jgi:Predicted dehydrogenases and related proteins
MEYSRRKFISTGALAVSALALHANGNPYRKKASSLRIGIIGTGSRGTGLTKMLSAFDQVEVVACCDILPDHLKRAVALTGNKAKMYTDYRKLLEDKTIDAVIIATPLYLHYPMAIDALDAGKHVYLEKSLAYDIPQTLELTRRVQQSGLVFLVGFQYRYFALYHKAKEIIANNWLGKITHFECQYNRNSNWRFPVNDPKMERIVNWRMYREYCGGPLSELCAHQLDAVHFLTGHLPVKVVGSGGINYWKDGRETYDHIRTIYDYPDGVQASVTSVLSNAYNGYCIRILGDKATLEIQRDTAFLFAESVNNKQGTVDGVTGATLLARTQGEAEELRFKEPGEKLPDPTILALQDFVRCIAERRTPQSNAETAYGTSIAIHLGNLAAETETAQRWKPEYNI